MTIRLARLSVGASPAREHVACKAGSYGLAIVLWLLAFACRAEICVTDDTDRELCLPRPAERIVALSPGATELLFAAGAGERVVAAVSFSNYPSAAEDLPRVGTYDRIDLEAVLALEPDLVVGWQSGNPGEQLARLEELGLPVYYLELRAFEDVATTLERLGRLAGTGKTARRAAKDFRRSVSAIRDRYADSAPVGLFYQIWVDPLMTVNNDHLISEAIELCGGDNVFGDLPNLVPRISKEAVLAADPEVIVAGGMGESDTSWLDGWRKFGGLTAVQRDNLFFVPPSTLQRPTPRLLQGTEMLCEHLETARERR